MSTELCVIGYNYMSTEHRGLPYARTEPRVVILLLVVLILSASASLIFPITWHIQPPSERLNQILQHLIGHHRTYSYRSSNLSDG
jgi:hypothetical protein